MDNNQPTDTPQASDTALEKLQADLDRAMNNWKRTAADFENFKKQKERENRELLEFAKEVTVVKLLPVLDVLEQALRHIPTYPERTAADSSMGSSAEPGKSDNSSGHSNFIQAYQNWQAGISGILAQLDKVLGELGIQKIDSVGKKFDPHFHEAVREVESEKDDGIILDEIQSGFILNGKVIRPSQVIVSKQKKITAQSDERIGPEAGNSSSSPLGSP